MVMVALGGTPTGKLMMNVNRWHATTDMDGNMSKTQRSVTAYMTYRGQSITLLLHAGHLDDVPTGELSFRLWVALNLRRETGL